jgi:hypothetical protein
MFVLRYYTQLQPCWDVVRGYSFFIGRNKAISMYAEGVAGIRANCVYWIGGNGKDQCMVFDMETVRFCTLCNNSRQHCTWASTAYSMLVHEQYSYQQQQQRESMNTPTAATE